MDIRPGLTKALGEVFFRGTFLCCFTLSTLAPTVVAESADASTSTEFTELQSLRNALYSANFAKAYEEAEKLNLEWEGEPEFDYLYALAALETGHFNESVFALERFLSSAPDNIRARLELGRAYFAINNLAAAEREFNYVLTQDIPDNVRKNVNPLLLSIDERRNSQKGSFQRFFSFGGGVDGNVNSGPEETGIPVPAGTFYPTQPELILDLGEESLPDDSAYSVFKAGLGYLYPISKQSWSWRAV